MASKDLEEFGYSQNGYVQNRSKYNCPLCGWLVQSKDRKVHKNRWHLGGQCKWLLRYFRGVFLSVPLFLSRNGYSPPAKLHKGSGKRWTAGLAALQQWAPKFFLVTRSRQVMDELFTRWLAAQPKRARQPRRCVTSDLRLKFVAGPGIGDRRALETRYFRCKSGEAKLSLLHTKSYAAWQRIPWSVHKDSFKTLLGHIHRKGIKDRDGVCQKVVVVDPEGDGNCLFRALAVHQYGSQQRHDDLRYDVFQWLRGLTKVARRAFLRREGLKARHLIQGHWSSVIDVMWEPGHYWRDSLLEAAAAAVALGRHLVIHGYDLSVLWNFNQSAGSPMRLLLTGGSHYLALLGEDDKLLYDINAKTR